MKKSLIALILGACTLTPVWAGQNYSIEVVPQADQKWRFQRLIAFSADAKTQVSGRMTASHRFALPRGHVDVAAYRSTGELIAETTSAYIPSILTHKMKKKGGVRFSATFAEPLPQDAIVKVAFHQDPPRTKVNPSHSGNIAK